MRTKLSSSCMKPISRRDNHFLTPEGTSCMYVANVQFSGIRLSKRLRVISSYQKCIIAKAPRAAAAASDDQACLEKYQYPRSRLRARSSRIIAISYRCREENGCGRREPAALHQYQAERQSALFTACPPAACHPQLRRWPGMVSNREPANFRRTGILARRYHRRAT